MEKFKMMMEKSTDFVLDTNRSRAYRALVAWFFFFMAMLGASFGLTLIYVVGEYFYNAVSPYIPGWVMYNIFIWGLLFFMFLWLCPKEEKGDDDD